MLAPTAHAFEWADDRNGAVVKAEVLVRNQQIGIERIAGAKAIAGWTEEERDTMRAEVPKLGLDARIRSRTLRDVALEVLDLAREGLHRRARRGQGGEDETHFLDTLFSIAGSGRTPAAELLEDFNTRWNGDLDRVYTDYAY